MESKLINHPTEVKETGWHKFRVHFCEYWYIYSCLFLALLVGIFFMVHQYYDTDEPIDSSIWGQYGDFVGGVLGTLISVLSVYYLIQTLKEQQKSNLEISTNNNHIADVYTLQQFDGNFSTLYSMYKDAIASYKYKGKEGKEALIMSANELFVDFKVTDDYGETKKNAQLRYDERFYIPNRDIASVHFRTLYQLFALIQKSEIDENSKVLYAKMIRSQMCEEELLLLRYNCHCHYGAKMRVYVNTFNLLKHLPLLSLGEFKKWRLSLDNQQKINRLDSEFIALRKNITNVIKGKTSDNKTVKIDYTGMYSLVIEAEKENKSLTLCLTRDNTSSSLEPNSVDDTFNTFTPKDVERIITDFLKEMFIYSNFGEYNKPNEINIETSITRHSTSAKTSIKWVVSRKDYPLTLSYDDLYSPTTK